MISFRKHIMLRPWFSWLEVNRIPVLVFLILLIHGSLLGLSDDEAYYWVLAQKPALGYAYHPPAVAWCIAFFQKLLGWMLKGPCTGLVRLPAALGTSLILGLSLNWLVEIGLDRKTTTRAALVMLSFFGFFSLAWMIVPDIPLIFGWTLLFVTTWRVCFSENSAGSVGIHGVNTLGSSIGELPPQRRSIRHFKWFLLLAVSSALTLLSKYSGILAVFSAFACLFVWAPRQERNLGWIALTVGCVGAAIPILIWNSEHQWASILYQIRDRHGGSLSWIRYLRFWAVELVLAGPILIGYGFVLVKKAIARSVRVRVLGLAPGEGISETDLDRRLVQYFAIWILPAAAVFCFQPLMSDFKPHWAFIVWWPVAIALAWTSRDQNWKWIKYQVIYGLSLGSFILVSCHIPLGNWIGASFSKSGFDPRLDVTNDLYGWGDLQSYIKDNLGKELIGNDPEKESLNLKVIGSRYQTASQAAFSLKGIAEVTLLPRDVKERDEWPSLDVSEGEGPGWPRLNKSILYVIDNRYTAMPEFPNAKCQNVGRFEKTRLGLLAKWIEIWKCNPT